MTKSSFAERLARQGRVQVIGRETSGSPEEVILRLERSSPAVITATMALARRGTTMLKAKRAIEKALEAGAAVIELTTVEDRQALARELAEAGIAARFRGAEDREMRDRFPARLKDLRARLSLSQEEFAQTYDLDKKTLQGWERGKIPDRGNRNFIRMIEKDPVTMKRLVNEE
ncbi:helix-turn-helix domain-containing protein [Cereibacter sphaeroides]|uniref:helix-turn-helix domain-containing protein n=1 Tax=Cereibacter sphaeroides TaxID=1063 RepID=UPI001F359537|nr:helix-turn-helix domain-containing protein [Cereibacter sphaeroides]MCE6957892.1 helix-turn-helix domain-containing protein [Cereibacter sphaeroides]MCE6971760.1 helix-turn-helix domain-containing protein [Cereibacter sphaeroides]